MSRQVEFEAATYWHMLAKARPRVRRVVQLVSNKCRSVESGALESVVCANCLDNGVVGVLMPPPRVCVTMSVEVKSGA